MVVCFGQLNLRLTYQQAGQRAGNELRQHQFGHEKPPNKKSTFEHILQTSLVNDEIMPPFPEQEFYVTYLKLAGWIIRDQKLFGAMNELEDCRCQPKRGPCLAGVHTLASYTIHCI